MINQLAVRLYGCRSFGSAGMQGEMPEMVVRCDVDGETGCCMNPEVASPCETALHEKVEANSSCTSTSCVSLLVRNASGC